MTVRTVSFITIHYIAIYYHFITNYLNDNKRIFIMVINGYI